MASAAGGWRRTARKAFDEVRGTAGTAVHTARRTLQPSRWTSISPHRVLRVSPQRIECLVVERIPESARGRRHAGPWDQNALPIDSTGLALALRRRFLDGAPWERSGLLEAGARPEASSLGRRYLAMSPSEAARRFAALDALHASLVRDGWLPHSEVGAPFVREMAVAIGRDGRLIRNSGGFHRLVLSRILGLGTVPIRVLVEHPELRTEPEFMPRSTP